MGLFHWAPEYYANEISLKPQYPSYNVRTSRHSPHPQVHNFLRLYFTHLKLYESVGPIGKCILKAATRS